MPSPLDIILVGRGLVGSVLLSQLSSSPLLGVAVRVVAVARSATTTFSPDGLEGPSFASAEEPTDLPALGKRFAATNAAVIVDCTASDATTALYPTWLRTCSVVTANKKGNSGDGAAWAEMRAVAEKAGTSFYYEANVGAGLPVLSTIRDMVRTGDELEKIEGVFSGTLSYIFNEFDGSVPFSQVVRTAKELGLTEPDPREDLGGTDVARKVVILAREIGMHVEMHDVAQESLVSDELKGSDVSPDAFLDRLTASDAEMSKLAEEASQAGEILRYVGVVDAQASKCFVGLRRYAKSHPFGRLTGSDNILSLRSKRYSAQPLVIQGPGAGADVTAAGVFADILKVAAVQGASRR